MSGGEGGSVQVAGIKTQVAAAVAAKKPFSKQAPSTRSTTVPSASAPPTSDGDSEDQDEEGDWDDGLDDDGAAVHDFNDLLKAMREEEAGDPDVVGGGGAPEFPPDPPPEPAPFGPDNAPPLPPLPAPPPGGGTRPGSSGDVAPPPPVVFPVSDDRPARPFMFVSGDPTRVLRLVPQIAVHRLDRPNGTQAACGALFRNEIKRFVVRPTFYWCRPCTRPGCADAT